MGITQHSPSLRFDREKHNHWCNPPTSCCKDEIGLRTRGEQRGAARQRPPREIDGYNFNLLMHFLLREPPLLSWLPPPSTPPVWLMINDKQWTLLIKLPPVASGKTQGCTQRRHSKYFCCPGSGHRLVPVLARAGPADAASHNGPF